MNLKRIGKCIIIFICIISVAATAYIGVTAQTAIKFVITAPTEIQSGKTVCVNVSLQNTEYLISSITFDLNYDSEKLVADAASLVCNISDTNGQFDYSLAADKGKITLMWDTTSTNKMVSGNIFTFVFTAKDLQSAASAELSTANIMLFDNNNKRISAVEASNAAIAISPVNLGDLSVYSKLSVISYPASWQDIVDAETAFSTLTAAQIKAFMAQHLDLYELLKNARTKYYELQEKAALSEILQAVKEFQASPVLKLTADTVTLKDKDAVNAIAKQYEAMSPQVKSRIDSGVKDHIKELEKAIAVIVKAEKDRNKALAEYEDFVLMYSTVWSLNADLVASNFSEIGAQLSDAMFYYENGLSGAAQGLALKEKEFLNKMYAVAVEYIVADEKETELMNQVAEFQKKWKYVISLSSSSVTIGDKSAIQMMMDDIDSLPAELQAKLALRKQLANRLLDKIATLGNGEKEVTEKVVYKDKIITQTVGSVSSQQATASTVKEQEQGSAQTAATNVTYNGTPMIVVVLLILLGVSLLSLIWPFIRLFKLFSSKRKATETISDCG